MRKVAWALVACAWLAAPAGAQTVRKKPVPVPTPPPAATLTIEAAEVSCASPLGTGVKTLRSFCDVPIGRTSGDGIQVTLPPHKGKAVLTFDLHNRQTYSEEQVKARRAYARMTATIGIMTADSTLITRAVVQNEFRIEADLFDRIGGGAGPGGLKAVAPTGAEPVRVELPENIKDVYVLGERLTVQRFDIDETFAAPGRPIALISNVMVEYTPQPAPKKAPARKPVPVPIKKK
jgi:hypothetical protein